MRVAAVQAELYGPRLAPGPVLIYDSTYPLSAIEDPLRLASVDLIQVRSHRPFWGLILGGTVGAAAGIGAGAFAESFCIFCAHGSREYSVGEGVLYGVGRAVVGMIVGGIVDSSIPKWRTVYRRPGA